MAKKIEGLSTSRLESLTDSIFAFAMTLLVLNFNVPKAVKGIESGELAKIIMSQSDRFLDYVLSFALLAVFWMINQQIFHHIKKTDTRHLWMSIFTLMFVVFIPFSTSLISEYPDKASGEFFFALNIFLISVFSQLGWIYANQEKRLVAKDMKEEHVRISVRAGWISPVVSALAMGLSFYQPKMCTYLYMTIPLLLLLPWFRKRQ